MSNGLLRQLRLNRESKERVGNLLEKLLTVPEFLEKATNAFGPSSLLESVANIIPWADVLDAAADALVSTAAPIRFLAEFSKRFKEPPNPESLAFAACTLAYHRALILALKEVGEPPATEAKPVKALKFLRENLSRSNVDFNNFNSSKPTSHAFFVEAQKCLESFSANIGYPRRSVERLADLVQESFSSELANILIDEQSERLRWYLLLQSESGSVYQAARDHGALQQSMFENLPAISREPFTLHEIYIELMCNSIPWSNFRNLLIANRANQLATSAERRSLTNEVMNRIKGPNLDGFIIVHGAPGSGKSAFGLALANQLLAEGFHPLRISLRDLHTLGEHPSPSDIGKQLGLAISLPDHWKSGRPDLLQESELFSQGRRIPDRTETICPFVLIIDGWDELRVKEPAPHEILLGKLLTYLKETFLERPLGSPIVRIVLLGRSSLTLWNNVLYQYLESDSVIHTLLPLNPKQLKDFLTRLGLAIHKPATREKMDKCWRGIRLGQLRTLVDVYTEAFRSDAALGSGPLVNSPDLLKHGRDLLSYPLLALLTVRLIAETRLEARALLDTDSTTLFREILDMTCEKAGRGPEDPIDTRRHSVLAATDLRVLLRSVAEAVEVLGAKSIGYDELGPRIEPLYHIRGVKPKETGSYLDLLKRLELSYYVTGTKSSFEFLHPSLQTYLFAEQIVKILIDDDQPDASELIRPIQEYGWKDFSIGHPCHQLSRRLSYLLAPRWLSSEAWMHLANILSWEVLRETDRLEPDSHDLRGIDRWIRLRDKLDLIWTWWLEGAHMRLPSDAADVRMAATSAEPWILNLARWAVPLHGNSRILRPVSFSSLDAHLGDGLFRLAAVIHWLVARREGIAAHRAVSRHPGRGLPRLNPSNSVMTGRESLRFQPAGPRPERFQEIVARINAAEDRPAGPFPVGVDMRGIDLRQAALSIIKPAAPIEQVAICQEADLTEARMDGSYLHGLEAPAVIANRIQLTGAVLHEANLQGAHLEEGNLRFARTFRANLSDAKMKGAKLGMMSGQEADFTNADLQNADLVRADLRGARFENANLSGANLSGAILDEAIFCRADLRGATLKGTSLRKANFQEAHLEGLDLSAAKVDREALRNAYCEGVILEENDSF